MNRQSILILLMCFTIIGFLYYYKSIPLLFLSCALSLPIIFIFCWAENYITNNKLEKSKMLRLK